MSPDAAAAGPVENTTTPDVAPVPTGATPDAMVTLPVAPAVAVPELNSSAPDAAPDERALAVTIVTAPDVTAGPLTTVTLPPTTDADVVEPAVATMVPPAPLLVAPTTTLILPEPPLDAAPDASTM